MSTEAKNHEYCNDTLKLRNEIETWFITVGERLYNIRQQQLYHPFWSSFEEYEMEFKWDPSQVSRLINIYKKFVLEYKIAPAQLIEAGGWTVLAETLPVIHSKADAEKWLKKTKTHSRADIRKDIKEAKGTLQKEEACKHRNSYLIRICEDCGLKERVYDNK